jgi:hypothetical protein
VVHMRSGYGMMVQFLRMGWWHIWSLGSVLRHTGVKLMAARVRSRQETVNARFKNWVILCTPYHHEFSEHQTVFGAIVVLTQLSLAANPLFHVEYNDKDIRLDYFTPSFHHMFYLFNLSWLVLKRAAQEQSWIVESSRENMHF